MKPMNEYFEKQALHIIAQLKKRNMEGFYCPSSEIAVQTALSLISSDSSVSWGGSVTLSETGLLDALKEVPALKLIDRSTAKDASEKDAVYHQALSADYFLMSSNAITLDGELVNIDGTGNRCAALIYGPKHVILMVGMNKVAKDEPAAIERVHRCAAPPNAMRIGMKTPCQATGVCADCKSPDCICAQTVITRFSRDPERIKVILIGETLGY